MGLSPGVKVSQRTVTERRASAVWGLGVAVAGTSSVPVGAGGVSGVDRRGRGVLTGFLFLRGVAQPAVLAAGHCDLTSGGW